MALYTKLSSAQINEFAAHYGFNPPQKYKGILEGTVNTYYQLAYLGKKFYLKIDEVGEKPRLHRELKILELLGQKKLPFEFPLPLSTTRKKLFVPFKNKFVLLFPEIQGQSLFGKNLKPSHLNAIGKNLAILHQKTRSQAKDLEPHRFDLKGMKQVYREIQTRLVKKHPQLDKTIKEWLELFGQHSPKNLPSGLIHADLFPENILFLKNKLHGFLDFEAAGYGEFLFDLGVTIHACTHDGKKFDLSKVKSFLKGYQEIRTLTKSEKKYFEFYLNLSALRFLLTRLRDFELKPGKVKASPFKDFKEFVRRFDENRELVLKKIL